VSIVCSFLCFPVGDRMTQEIEELIHDVSSSGNIVRCAMRICSTGKLAKNRAVSSSPFIISHVRRCNALSPVVSPCQSNLGVPRSPMPPISSQTTEPPAEPLPNAIGRSHISAEGGSLNYAGIHMSSPVVYSRPTAILSPKRPPRR
jgi:hypothetical protein